VKLTRPDLDLPLTGRAEVLLANKVEVTGDVDLLPGGRIDVSGKTFVVEAGEVHFDTGDPGNPRIRVTAIYRPSDGSVITAEVAGTLKQATLSLSSPTKDLQQIYATLLGGTSGGEGGDARAAGAGVGADQLLGPLLANTPLRKVEIRTGSELAADRRSYSTYSAAVPLSEQVWFEGSYKTLNSQDSREQGSALSGTIDFRFRRNWSLRTEVGTIGTGVDLLWNYRY
jgi:autotransporter translocation and assembly factor TamB